ncbi:uncharacterized protein LOC142542585 [Primulina tabacum]|uniref:uncharacterized protein LOC142542585 n=1 Tax=Primulina tabacum TaxID=48773 RepID=UPI003F593BB5
MNHHAFVKIVMGLGSTMFNQRYFTFEDVKIVMGLGKLKIGSHDDDTIHEPSKRLGQPPVIGKGKEKIVSTSTDKSFDGKEMLGSTDTETTRTSRRRTHLDKLSRRRVQGIRKEVRFNLLGQPVGEVAAKMQSYIGVLAREKVKITYKTWKQVPSEVKELIWESVNLTFDVPPSWKKGCLSSANNKWRQFKSHLTQTFISNKVDKPEELDQPPTGYGLARDDWISFVMTRMYDKFIASELCDDDDINRAIIWKKGRVNKEGDFDGQELQITVEKIREGKLEIKETKKDIFTKALNSDEHGGRVRAVGGHITPTLYFNVGRSWKTEDVERKLMIEQKKELIEATKLIQEQDTRIQKLEAIVYKKGAWDSEIDDKGSCSVKLHQVNENEMKIDKFFPSYEDLNDVEMKVVEKCVALQIYNLLWLYST